MNCNKTAKLVLLGDAGVGKTSIVVRFTDGYFTKYRESTIGAAFLTKKFKLDNSIIKFEIWDTAGQERYRSLTPMYYRGAKVAIIVYDITNNKSYKSAKKWIIELKKSTKNSIIIAIVGNKVDMADKRNVQEEFAKNFADTENLIFYEVSAKHDINIKCLFKKLGEMVLSSIEIPMGTECNIDLLPKYKNDDFIQCCN